MKALLELSGLVIESREHNGSRANLSENAFTILKPVVFSTVAYCNEPANAQRCAEINFEICICFSK